MALANKGSIKQLPETIRKPAPPRLLSPFDEQAEKQEAEGGGVLNLDGAMSSFNQSGISQFDTEDDVPPNTEDLEDTHGEMVHPTFEDFAAID